MEGIDKNTFKRIFHEHWDAFKQFRPRFNKTLGDKSGPGAVETHNRSPAAEVLIRYRFKENTDEWAEVGYRRWN